MGVRWKWIKNYRHYYLISTDGRLKSVDRIVRSKNNSFRLAKGRTTRGTLDITSGYYLAHLWKLGKCKTKPVHQLVAKSFVPNPLHKPEVNHKDGVKTNNHVTNLEWTTRLENAQHASKFKLLRGNTKPRKLSDDQVLEILRQLKRGIKRKILAKKFKVSHHTITDIALGRTRKRISIGGYYHRSPT